MPDYFTLAEFRTLPDMYDTDQFPDARVNTAAAYITSIIEREVGTAFVARTASAEKHNGGLDSIGLRKRDPIAVTSATENGVTVTDTLTVVNGLLRRFSTGATTPTYWASGIGNVSVTYTYGYTATISDVPGDIKEAAMRGTRAYLLETSEKSGVLDRRSSVSNDVGGTTTYVVAGSNQPTGYPQVDAVILGWKARTTPIGFA